MYQSLPALVTVLAVLLLFATAWAVGSARVRYQVKAPATSGHPTFERAFRVQMNTLEATAMFLPVLWVATYYGFAAWAGIAGVVWLAGRTWYAVAYLRDAARRGGGFMLGSAAWAVVLVLAGFGAVRALLAG